MMPQLTIAIPAYNAEPYIRTTLTSCLQQTTPAFEILLSDDGSTDHTPHILQEYADHPGVRLVSPPQRLGLGGHYRHLVEQARGTHLVMLSCDDALHPQFIQRAVQSLNQQPDLGMLIFSGYFCNAAMQPQSRFGLSYPRQTLQPPAGFDHFINACTYLISFTVWPTALLKALPPLPDQAGFATDWYWALNAGLQAPIKFSRRPLGYYRYHEANASHSNRDRWTQQAIEMLTFLASHDWLEPERREQVLSCRKRYTEETTNASENQPVKSFSVNLIKQLLKRLSVNSLACHPGFLR
jgi:glycosyltransferase involved in cell wall biosynthesis